MPDDVSTEPSYAVRRWTRTLADLRLRFNRNRSRSGIAPELNESDLEDALDLCGLLLQETAAAELKLRGVAAEKRREREVHAHVIDKLPIACVVTDAAGYIRSANRAAALLLGVSAGALRGRLFLLFAEDRAGFQDLLHARGGGTHYATLTLRPRELRPLKVEVTLAPDAPDQATGWVWFLQPHETFLRAAQRETAPGPKHDDH